MTAPCQTISLWYTLFVMETQSMNTTSTPTTVMITGTAGFIGYHLAALCSRTRIESPCDGMTDYYDVTLKQRRHQMLKQNAGFTAHEAMLEEDGMMQRLVADHQPEIVVHLAAQAGVRYSIDNPRSYVNSNLVGSFNVMDAAHHGGVRHLLMASTSSVYGANTEMPFAETQQCDTPMSFYAATKKKANEAMAHAWSHIHGLPVTMFRFSRSTALGAAGYVTDEVCQGHHRRQTH